MNREMGPILIYSFYNQMASTSIELEDGFYSDGIIQARYSGSESDRLGAMISPYQVQGMKIEIIEDESNSSFRYYITGVAEPGSTLDLYQDASIVTSTTADAYGSFYLNRSTNTSTVDGAFVRMEGTFTSDTLIPRIEFPDTNPSIESANAPYIIDNSTGGVSFQVVDTEEYSLDGGENWLIPSGPVTIPDGVYTRGTIRLRGAATLGLADQPQLVRILPSVLIPCTPLVPRVRFRTATNTTLVMGISPGMVMNYSVGPINSSTTWIIVNSDGLGTIYISAGSHPLGTEFNFVVGYSNYDIESSGPIVTIPSTT